MDETSNTANQTTVENLQNNRVSSSSSSSTAAAADVIPTTQPPSYDAAAKRSDDIEAGLTADEVTVTTSPPPASAAAVAWADDDNCSCFSDMTVRLAFIRKVYLILTAQLTFTVVCICICLFSSTIKAWVQDNLWLYFTAYGVFAVTYIILAFFPKVRRKVPANYICLVIFTIAVSFMAAIISSFHDTVIVLVAMGMTVAVCLSVSIFAIQTRIDFTLRHGMLFAAVMVLILCALTCFIFFLAGFYYYLNVLYAGIIAMIFVLFLVFDTQQVIGGSSYQLSAEEYITGALELYIDIIYVFLIILGASKN